MNDAASREMAVAVVKSCKQYRYKIELPRELGKEARAAIRRDALREASAAFLNCSRNYQEAGWVGVANVSFADTKTSPSDSKSEFIHSLICMRIIELSAARLRADGGLGEGTELFLKVEARLTWSSRKLFGKLCENLGIRMVYEPTVPAGILRKPQIGGAYRPRRESLGAFTQQPIKRIEDVRAAALRRLSGRALLKKCVHGVLNTVILLLWPLPIAARVIFSLIYQVIALPVLASLDGPRNVFVYFDLRLGKNRDVPSYLRWKFGNALAPDDATGKSYIPFSHLARPSQAYSFSAMMWALRSLVRMRSNPLAGCVVVNYLIPPWLLFKVRCRRKALCRTKRRRLRALQREAPDFLSFCIYEEFINSLEQSAAFPVEVSRCYKKFFDMMTPGVVLQADAAAKTARHFTVCARQRGGRVVYVADRICTELRTSNQFICDAGSSNFHIPNRCVVFDQVSKDEFLRQGMGAGHIHTYHRNFAPDRDAAPKTEVGGSQVVILLQAYEDNIEAMVRVGTNIARRMKKLRVVYQEHPNFPLCDRMKAKLRARMPRRLHFLKPGEPVDYHHTLALITGYSTAAVPGILHGVPLIWLRRQIDNSIFGEAYLGRIGFAADKFQEVISVLKKLQSREKNILKACANATLQAREIFVPTCSQSGTGLADALGEAVEASFAEIARAAARQQQPEPGRLEPANA